MKPLLIVNPCAAGSRTGGRWTETAVEVDRRIGPFDAAFTERPGHAEVLARESALSGRELVVAVGGDGTLSEVVNGVLTAFSDRPPVTAVGLIAQGTGGDFRRSLGIGRSPEACLERLAVGADRLVDVVRLDCRGPDGDERRRYFVNIASAGMGGLVDRFVAASPRWMGGRVAYYAATMRALASVPLARLRCRVCLDGESSVRDIGSRMLAVCNGAYFGSGMNVAPMAKVDDGRLEVVSIGTRTKAELLVRSRSVYGGDHLRYKSVQHFSCQSIELDLLDETSADAFPLDVDGDPGGLLPLRAAVVPGALRVRA